MPKVFWLPGAPVSQTAPAPGQAGPVPLQAHAPAWQRPLQSPDEHVAPGGQSVSPFGHEMAAQSLSLLQAAPGDTLQNVMSERGQSASLVQLSCVQYPFVQAAPAQSLLPSGSWTQHSLTVVHARPPTTMLPTTLPAWASHTG